jgi:dipeptidyl aminopeptidase/acylaminoacyl peptidase
MRFRFASLLLAASLFFVPGLLAQQTKPHPASSKARQAAAKPQTSSAIDGVLRALNSARHFEQVAISPDGKSVAWVESIPGKNGASSGNSAIYISSADGKTPPRHLTASPAQPREEGSLAWSPDSKKIAFLSDAASSGQRQLYVASAAGGPARKLTAVKGFLASPSWSPDGRTIAVLFIENAPRAAGPLVAASHETGVIKDAFFEQRLALIDVTNGKLRQLSPADMYIYEYGWSPDGKRFAVTAAPGNGDNNWWIAQLYTLDASSGAMKSIYKPKLQIASPVFSPNSESVAFIEGLMSDEGSVGGDVYAVPAAGGNAQDLTPGMKASASSLIWTKKGHIVFGAYAAGDSTVASVDPASREFEVLYRGGETLTRGGWGISLSLADDGETSAVIRSSVSAPPEVWTGPVGAWEQVTHANKAVKPAWGQTKSIHWKNEGFDIQGWLDYPRDFNPAKKYPLIVYVHGGPGSAVTSAWPGSGDFSMALAASGYFVLKPNPRGSFGMGEAFTRANVRDFGYGDFRDIMAGVDEAIKTTPIDPNRLGITGWSYGGFMTMWAVTQTNRFKAAMAGAGIANWLSYYGENKIDQWMIPFFGKSVYDDPDVYAKSSPINFIKKAKTPTLILVGDSDAECPTPQSYEFWHALKAQGVETELVVYKNEGHMFVQPDHLRDRITRTIAWFNSRLR